MVRTPSCDKNGQKKGTWTPEEDRKLIACVTRYGCWNWRQLPRFAGLERCGKSCRLRWMNYLRPNIKRGNYTQEEEEIIITQHEKLGNRWSVIAAHLPGRTDNEIKNHWHTALKKRFQKNAVTHENVKATKSNDSGSKQDRDSVQNNGFFHVTPPTTNSNTSVDSGPLSPQLSTNENLAMEDDLNFLDAYIEPVNENFWTTSFLADISDAPIEIVLDNNGNCTFQGSDTTNTTDAWALSPQSSSTESLVQENEYFAFLDETQPTIESFWTQPFVADCPTFQTSYLNPW